MNVIHIAETVKGGVATVINNLTENNEIDSHVICPESQSKEIYCAQKTLFSRTGRNISSLSSLFLVIIKTLKSWTKKKSFKYARKWCLRILEDYQAKKTSKFYHSIIYCITSSLVRKNGIMMMNDISAIF